MTADPVFCVRRSYLKDKRKNRTFRRGLLTALTLLWMIFIFFMSSANQQESDYQSDTVIDVICSTFINDYDDMTSEEKLVLQERLTFPVRKAAHMTEYAILGVLLSLTGLEYLSGCPRCFSAGMAAEDAEKSAETDRALSEAADSEAAALKVPADETSGRGVSGLKTQKDPALRVTAAAAEKPGFTVFLPALLIGFLYACSDEFHQRFVPGRSGEFRDVVIDTAGVLIGIAIVLILFPALKHRNGRKKSV